MLLGCYGSILTAAARVLPSYTLATGLWPESHGIVGNSFTDPATGAAFSMRSKEPAWWGGEPIWATAEKAGVKTSPAMWPGADVDMSGVGAPNGGLPTYGLSYTRDIDKYGRVEFLLEQLRRPVESQPRLLTLYMEDMDDAGHGFGPDSPELSLAMLEVDRGFEALVEGLKTLTAATQARINFVIVGDHGMVGTNSDRVLLLPELQDDPELRSAVADAGFGLSPVLGVRPAPGRERAVMGKLQAAVDSATREEARARPYSAGLPRLSLSYKSDLPARLHFNAVDQDRIPPIVGIVAEGWTLQSGEAVRRPGAGSHGYDNTCHSMETMFVGWGPAFAATQGTGNYKQLRKQFTVACDSALHEWVVWLQIACGHRGGGV